MNTVTTSPDAPRDAFGHLQELETAYLDGDYPTLLLRLQQWEAAWPDAPAAQRERARMLGLHSLSKQGEWAALIKACGEALRGAQFRQASARVQLLVLWSFGELQLGAIMRALEVAWVGQTLALELGDPGMSAQTQERLAMVELSLGDAVAAESHMLESIGYALQLGDHDVSLLRYSNGLFLFNALKQALRDHGRTAQAHALRLRMQRYVTQGRKIESRARKPYERCMWQANLAVWQLRSGRSREAEQQLRQVHAQAQQMNWLHIRRSVALELAGLAAADGEWEQALHWLHDAASPPELPPRRRHALQIEQGLAQALAQLGRGDAAAQAAARAQALADDPIQAEALDSGLSEALKALLTPEQLEQLHTRLTLARRGLSNKARLRIRGVG